MATEIASAYIKLIPSTSGLKSEVEKALGGAGESAGKSAGGKFASALGTAAKVGAAGIAAATTAVGAFAKSAISAGMDFDSSMSQVAATMGVTTDQIGELRDFAMEMGASTAFSATEAADALNYMALAGYDSQQSMEMLPNVLNLAAAGSMDLAAASDMITDSQTALGLSFEQTNTLVDQMAKTASTTNTSVSQLGEAILSVGGTAKNLAGGTDELNAVLGIFADNGIKGSEAGIHLRNIMLAMNPTTDAAIGAFEKLGLEAYDSEGSLKSLDSIFLDLSKSMEEMTDQEKTDILSKIFNKTDLTTVNALLATTSDRWGEVYTAIGNSEGAAQQMAETQLDNLAGDMTLFQSALEGAKIVVSDELTPTLREFVQFGSSGISEIATAFQEGGLSGAMGAFGTVLSDGIGMVTEMLPEIVLAGHELLMSLVSGIIDNLPMVATAAGEILTTIAGSISDNLAVMLPALVGVLLEIVTQLTSPESIQSLVGAAISLMTGLATGLIDAIPQIVAALPTIIENIIEGLLTALPELATTAWTLMGQLAGGLIEAIPDILSAVWELGKSIVSGVWQGIQSMWSTFWESVSGFFSGIVNGVKNLLGIHSPSTVFAGIGENMGKGLPVGLNRTAAAVRNSMRSVVDGALTEADRMPSRLGMAVDMTASVGWYARQSGAQTAASEWTGTNGSVVFQLVDSAWNVIARGTAADIDSINGRSAQLFARGVAT